MPVSTSTVEAVPAGAHTHRSTEPTRRRSLEALILGSLGVFVVFLDTTVVNIAFPTISRNFHTTTAHLAWVLSAYSLVFAATLIPAGRLADRYGRKRLFIAGIVGFAVMSALCGLAPNPGVLIAGRALQGVFSALVVPTSLALILPEFPPERRHVAVGTWGMAGAAAAALGPTIGALLTQSASWRWIFLINIPVCAAIVGFGLPVIRESRDRSALGFPDPAEIVLIAAIPALLSFAILQGPEWGWTDPRVIGGFVLAALLFPVFFWRASTSTRPVMDLSLFKVRQFRLANAATVLFSTAFFGMLLANVIFLQTQWHYSILMAALASAPGPLLVTAVARPSSKLASRIGYRPVLLAGAASWAAGSAALALAVGSTPNWLTHWLPYSLLIGLGIGLTLPVQSGASAASLPPSRYAIGSAINASFRQLGAVLGISIFVAVLGTPTALTAVRDYHRTWWVFGALGLASGLVLLIPQLRRRPLPRAPSGSCGEVHGESPGWVWHFRFVVLCRLLLRDLGCAMLSPSASPPPALQRRALGMHASEVAGGLRRSVAP